MTHKEIIEYYNKLDNGVKQIINGTIFATMNMCSELVDEPLFFNDEESFKTFRETALLHLGNNEFYDYDSKKWIKLDPIIPVKENNIIN